MNRSFIHYGHTWNLQFTVFMQAKGSRITSGLCSMGYINNSFYGISISSFFPIVKISTVSFLFFLHYWPEYVKSNISTLSLTSYCGSIFSASLAQKSIEVSFKSVLFSFATTSLNNRPLLLVIWLNEQTNIIISTHTLRLCYTYTVCIKCFRVDLTEEKNHLKQFLKKIAVTV